MTQRTAMARKPRSADDDRLAQAHGELVAAVESIASGDDWRRMLEVAARFHKYSAGNVMLITFQRPEATRVAGYRTWQSLGRQVRKGERGITILAPCKFRRTWTDEETGDEMTMTGIRGFTTAHVFDLSQTDGEELPDVRPALIDGNGPACLWDGLAQQVKAAGFDLARGYCGGANGTTDYATKVVTVRDDVSTAQACKTLAHELAHVLMHDGTAYVMGCRGRVEVEAESVAFLVCQAAGLTSDGYTFPYVARWANGNAKMVQEAAERVIGTARSILEPLLDTEPAVA